MDYTDRFSGKGEIYAKARPKYAQGLFEYFSSVMNIPPGSIFADIGSGTGIFTRQLLDCGYKVFAVEPNDDMRSKAEEKLSVDDKFVSVCGSDGDTKLSDNSVDFVTAAQAFHWFDADAFKAECRRILRPNGKIIIVYNSRNESADCTKALAALRRKYNSDFHGFSNGMSEGRCIDFFGGDCNIYRADNTQRYTRREYIDRVLSSSYSLKKDDDRFSMYMNEINNIFDAYSKDGIISVPTDTVAYIGSV